MDISGSNTEDLAAFLNRAWQNAQDGANTLPAQLLSEQQAAVNYIATGSIGSVGKNSANQTYAFYAARTLTHVEITRLWTRLIRQEKEVRNYILKCATRDGVTIATDFDLDPAVKDLLERVLGVSTEATAIPDIRLIRVPLCPEVCA